MTSRTNQTVLRGELDWPPADGAPGAGWRSGHSQPASIQESMERKMKADREKRGYDLTARAREAAISSAEGQKQSQILPPRSQDGGILTAEADRQLGSCGPRRPGGALPGGPGQAKAIAKCSRRIQAAKPTPECWPTVPADLPQMARASNKVWMSPRTSARPGGCTRMLGAPARTGVTVRASPSTDDVADSDRRRRRDDKECSTRPATPLAKAVADAEAQPARR